MTELISTAKSPWVDPHLHVWGWEIPVYLFLGGWTAGIMVLCGWALWKGRRDERPHATFSLASSGLFMLAFMAISLGMVALFLDLEHKLYTWRLYLTFEPASPMSWGAWILMLVYPVLLVGILLDPPRTALERIPPQLRSVLDSLADNLVLRRVTGLVSIGTGVALGIYTGILLSALGARPLWSSAILGPLFLFSGLSAAAAFAHWASPDQAEREYLAKIDNQFLASELALVLLFVIGLVSSTEAHLQAAQLILGGPYTAVFWVGVVGLGIVLPLIIQSLAVTHRVPHTPLAPVLVLLGGLALRFVIVSAGQVSHWSPL